MAGIIVDIGAGDGKFVYKLAKEYPDRFVIGIDPYHEGLTEASEKIYKKPEKGGLPNALYVLANVIDIPHELDNIANQIFINFPWGSLLEGLIKGDSAVWKNIRRIAKKGAQVDVLLGYEDKYEGGKIKIPGLPELNELYFRSEFAAKLEKYDFKLLKLETFSSEQLKNYPSSWAKRLAYGKERNFYHLILQVE